MWDFTSGPGSYYTANTLAKSKLTDENGNITYTFTDKLGRTVLKKVQVATNSWLETYYVYDTRGNLIMQVPPKAVATTWSTTMRDKLCFIYTYDVRNRLVQKKTPDADAVYYGYDPLGRLVLTQDANLRASNKWAFIKYDIKGRPVMSGLYTNTTYTTLSTVQTNVLDVLYPSLTDIYYEERGTTLHGYTNVSFPTANAPSGALDIMAVSYYDNYDFDNNGTDEYGYTVQSMSGEGSQGNAFGMPTGSKKVILGTSTWLYTYQFYDRFGRVIQVRSNNHKSSAIDNLSTVIYDFEGKVLKTKSYHNAGSANQVVTVTRNEYDFAGRLTKIYHSINGAQETVNANYKYNELGQVVEKNLHCADCSDPVNSQAIAVSGDNITRSAYSSGEQTLLATASITLSPGYNTSTGNPLNVRILNSSSPVTAAGSGSAYLQSVDYRYHIRGWLNSINNAQLSDDSGATNDDTNDYFGMELAYNDPAGMGNVATYNGNISAVKWKANGVAGAADQRSYRYKYDKSDRLQSAAFQANTGSAWTKEANTLNETIAYDENGNITSLGRWQNQRGLSGLTVTSTPQKIDSLGYTYANGNQLSKVEDVIATTIGLGDFKNGSTATTEYTYNTNGSIISDLNKGITAITYNVLNKPYQVTMSGKSITYIYDAAGTKLKMITTIGSVTDTTHYIGGFVYKNSALTFFSSPEGRVIKNGSKYEYQYSITDHQGNTRILFTSAAPAAQSVTATFESGVQTAEATNFPNYPVCGGCINNVSTNNHTSGGTSSQYLNGGYTANAKVGVAKSYHVFPGDVVAIEAYGKYNAPSGTDSNMAGFATALLSAFGFSPPGVGETGTARAGLNAWGAVEATGYGYGSTDNTAPKAFVTILLYDKNYNFINATYQQITTASASAPTLMSASVPVKEEGYAYMYVSNEHPTLVDIYFDDVKMTYTPGRVVQSNEYYAFGLQTANSWTRENATANNFLGNGGTELNTTTALYDLDYRNYDPILGRMNQVDPMADKFGSITTYNYSFNNPVTFNDVSGAVPGVWSSDIAAEYEGGDWGTRNADSRRRAHSGVGGDYGTAGWDGYVGNYNLDGGGYGFAPGQYSNPSIIVDANFGAENATNYVTVGGNKPTVGVRYENPTDVNQYVAKQSETSGIGGLIYLGAKGNVLGMTAGLVRKASNGGWLSTSSTQVFETQGQFAAATKLGGLLNHTPWDFLDGFLNPSGGSTSLDPNVPNLINGWGGVIESAALNAKLTAERASTWSKRATELKGLRALNIASKSVGFLGASVPLIQVLANGQTPTWGNAAQVGVGLALVFTGPAGLIYLVADIGVGIATGYTITDRIGYGVDYSVSKGR